MDNATPVRQRRVTGLALAGARSFVGFERAGFRFNLAQVSTGKSKSLFTQPGLKGTLNPDPFKNRKDRPPGKSKAWPPARKFNPSKAGPPAESGCRDVDIHPDAAVILRNFIGDRKSGFLFQTSNGTMFAPGCIARDSLDPILQEMGRAQMGTRFNIFRRFREAVLQRSDARHLLIDFWMGHSNAIVADRCLSITLANRRNFCVPQHARVLANCVNSDADSLLARDNDAGTTPGKQVSFRMENCSNIRKKNQTTCARINARQ